ncbi:MAG: vWA domain-containing protein, partial [Planctomycetota bacterium]
MRFLNPSLLLWGALLAVPALLYLFRRKPRRVRVSTLLFFKTLARAYQEAAWLRYLKRILSFLLNAAIIVWAVGALARPVVAPKAGALNSVVILVDRSASMAARNGGATRLEAGIARVRQRLAGLPAGVGVMVMTYDRRPEILLPFSLDRREVERTLATLTVRPIEDHAEPALLLARRMARLDTPASIWHVTDAPAVDLGLRAAEWASEEVAVREITVAVREPVNVGITAFRLRRLPLARSRYQAFVQVHAAGPRAQETELEIRIDDQLIAVRSLTVKSEGRERLLIPLDAGEGSILSLRMSAEGDVLPLDDTVHARIPPLRPIEVLWVSPEPDPFTELALRSLGEEEDVAVFKAKPSAWPPDERPDVVLFDGWLPKTWPSETAVLVMDPPDGGLGPIQAARLRDSGLPVDRVRATDDRHPVLYGVATARVSVTQTA